MWCRGGETEKGFSFLLGSQANYRGNSVMVKFSLTSSLWHATYTTFS